jgi:hypothetical protein
VSAGVTETEDKTQKASLLQRHRLHKEGQDAVLQNRKVLSVVPKETLSGYTEVSSGRTLGGIQSRPNALSDGVFPSGGALFRPPEIRPGLGSQQRVPLQGLFQSRTQLSHSFGRCCSRPTAEQFADSVGNLSAEPVKCTVYRQKLGAAGRADQTLESGPGTSALLVAAGQLRLDSVRAPLILKQGPESQGIHLTIRTV